MRGLRFNAKSTQFAIGWNYFLPGEISQCSLAEPQSFNLTKNNQQITTQDRNSKNAEAQTWKQQLGSFGYRARLHGHELPSWSRPRQECNDSADPQSSGAWRYLFRYRRSLRPIHQRRTCGRSTFSVPLAGNHCHEVRVQVRERKANRLGQPTRAYPSSRRRISQTAQIRKHRSLLPAPL